jgi:hypothetical protein
MDQQNWYYESGYTTKNNLYVQSNSHEIPMTEIEKSILKTLNSQSNLEQNRAMLEVSLYPTPIYTTELS